MRWYQLSLRYFLAPIPLICLWHTSLSVEFPGISLWTIRYTLWSVLHLSDEIFLLSMPSLTFSFVIYSRGSESDILITVYLSSDHPTFSAKTQGPTYNFGHRPYNIHFGILKISLVAILFYKSTLLLS